MCQLDIAALAVVLSSACCAEKAAPLVVVDDEDGAGRSFRVAHSDNSGDGEVDLDAVASVGAARGSSFPVTG